MAVYSFKIAAGHNVGLGSLVNVEEITQIGRPPSIPQSPNPFPVRKKYLSGRVAGSGYQTYVWEFDVMPMTGIKYIIDTYLYETILASPFLMASSPVTIFTRRTDRGGWARYNAYLEYPSPGTDYTEDAGFAVNLKLKFHHMVQI